MNVSRIILISGALLTGSILMAYSVSGQSSKQIRERGINCQTVLEVFIEKGMDKPVIEKKEMYNENGNITEVVEYNKKGNITNWQKFEYDEDENVTSETQLDNKGRVVSRIKTIYENKLKTEKQYFDGSDRMYKKKFFKYEYSGQQTTPDKAEPNQ